MSVGVEPAGVRETRRHIVVSLAHAPVIRAPVALLESLDGEVESADIRGGRLGLLADLDRARRAVCQAPAPSASSPSSRRPVADWATTRALRVTQFASVMIEYRTAHDGCRVSLEAVALPTRVQEDHLKALPGIAMPPGGEGRKLLEGHRPTLSDPTRCPVDLGLLEGYVRF